MKTSPSKIPMFFACLIVSGIVGGSESQFLNIVNRTSLQNWRVVNARLFLSETGLRVLAEKDKPRPVLRIGELTKTSHFLVKVSLRITNPGTVGVAWMQSKGDSAPRRRATFKKLKPKDSYQTVTLKIPVNGLASDFEVLTPWGDSTIEKITFSDGGDDQEWLFVTE